MKAIIQSLLGVALLSLGACASDGSDLGADIEQEEAEPLAQRTGPAIGFGCRSPRIALRASSGHYLVAENGGGDVVKADRIAAGPWETFVAGDQGFGKITLRASSGHYVVAENGGGGDVNANRTAIGPWEIFTVERQSFFENVWSFQASNGQYLVAEGGGGGEVNADRNEVGPWEKFTVICM